MFLTRHEQDDRIHLFSATGAEKQELSITTGDIIEQAVASFTESNPGLIASGVGSSSGASSGTQTRAFREYLEQELTVGSKYIKFRRLVEIVVNETRTLDSVLENHQLTGEGHKRAKAIMSSAQVYQADRNLNQSFRLNPSRLRNLNDFYQHERELGGDLRYRLIKGRTQCTERMNLCIIDLASVSAHWSNTSGVDYGTKLLLAYLKSLILCQPLEFPYIVPQRNESTHWNFGMKPEQIHPFLYENIITVSYTHLTLPTKRIV